MSVTKQVSRATVKDLYGASHKAELFHGKLVPMPPTGIEPGFAADEIFASLREYARRTGIGRAVGDNKAFVVNLPDRQSFSPDAAFCRSDQRGMKFYQGAPELAVEVRSEGDYGAVAEKAIAAKRADYFAAGTQVVWDVDLLSDEVVRVYRRDDPDKPLIFRHGDCAEAEPAVPGWSMPVDDLFLD